MKLLFLLSALFFFGSCEASGPGGNSEINSNSNTNIVQNVNPVPSPSQTGTARPGNTVTGDPTPNRIPLPPDAQGVQAAIDVLHEYYAAINSSDYRKAYQLWAGKGEASKQTFEQFRDGFSNTGSVEIDTSGEPGDMEGAAGSQYVEIPMLIKAKTKDGKVQNFWGQYILRRSMVDGSTTEQRLWRIYSAEIRKQ